MKKLLGIFAHPDDEAAIQGGTLAKYARTGWQVDVVCATRGEAGNWGDVPNLTGALLAEVRSKELEESAALLGIRSITFLDYKDGTLSSKTPGDIEEKLISVMSDIQPDVVITHEPGGVTNHPDHSKLSYAATYAFQTYAQGRYNVNPNDDNPPKLYYSCIPETELSYLTKHTYFPGELFGKPIRGVEDKRITTVINIKQTASVKRKALQAHATQAPILAKYLDIPGNNPFFRQEYFIRRYTGVNESFMGKNDRIADRL